MPPSRLAQAQDALAAAVAAVERVEGEIAELSRRRENLERDIDDLNRVDADQDDRLGWLEVLLGQLGSTEAMLPVLSKWKLQNNHRAAQATEDVDNIRREITITRAGLLEHDHRLRQLRGDRTAGPVTIDDAERARERLRAELERLGGEAA